MVGMTPILYEAGEKSFLSLGIGKLRDAVSCIVEEEYNTDFVATVEVPIGCDFYNDVKEGNIIVCKPEKYTDDVEAFEIVTTEASTGNGTKIATCRQVTLQRMKSVIVGRIAKMTNTTASAVMQAVNSAMINRPESTELQITMESDVEIINDWENKVPATLYDVFFAEETGIIACFGGELKFHLGNIKLCENRGEDRGQTVKYGRNMTHMTVTVDTSEVVNGICAYYAKEDTSTGTVTVVMGTNKIVYTDEIETSYARVIPIDCTSYIAAPTGAPQEWVPTPAQVEEWANLYLKINYDGMVPVNVSSGITEDPQYENEREIHMADIVRLHNPMMGTSVKAKIVRTAYNCLSDEWEGVDVGSVRSNLAQTIVDMMKSQQKIEQVYTGGGNVGDFNGWHWEISNDGNSATVSLERAITNETCGRYGSYYYVQKTETVPDYFANGWDVVTSSIRYGFTATDEASVNTQVYLKGYEESTKTMTVYLLTTTSVLNGILTGSVRLKKSST